MEILEFKVSGKVRITDDTYDYDVYVGADPLSLILTQFDGKQVEIIVRSK